MNTPTPRTDAAVKLTFAAIRELNRLLRFCAERPGGAVMSQRMEGAADARRAIRKEIRERIRELELNKDALDIEYFRELAQAEAECLQQAIANGKGAEREADLLGKVERLERELAALRHTLATTTKTV